MSAHYTATESQLVQGLAKLHARAGISIVRGQSAQSSSYTRDGAKPPALDERTSPGTIDAEEARLVARAKAEGFFWGEQALLSVSEAVCLSTTTGTEHDVYVVGQAPNMVVIRNTVKDSFRFAHTSPAQYLQRLADYNAVFPSIQVRLIGVSQNTRGNGVVWTAQPFVYGEELRSDNQLRAALKAAGWVHLADITYWHTQTGVTIQDAHTGNILHCHGELFPVDVIVTLPSDESGNTNA